MAKTKKHPLERWREAQNPPVGREALANQIGRNRWTIFALETGIRQPSRTLALEIIKATNGGVTIEDLMLWEPSEGEAA